MDIAKKLREQAQKSPDKPFIIFNDKTITFKEAIIRINKAANFLIKHGVKKGDRVAIYLPNSPEYIFSYFAVFTLGAVAVPLDARLTPDELVGVLHHSEASFIFSRPLPGIREKVPHLKLVIDNFNEMTKLESDELNYPEIRDDDLAIFFYTSGTTGHPKAVMLNYRHLDNAPMIFERIDIVKLFDVIISALPLSHLGGFVALQINAAFGSTLILMERFIPLEFLKNVERYKATFFFMVPPMFIALLQLKEFDKYDLKSLRGADVFGAPSDPRMIKRFGMGCPNASLFNGWGMTETSAPNTVSEPNRIESVGKSAPWCQIRIFDHKAKELPQGEIGEVVIKGWPVMAGYYKEPRLTQQTIKDGWLYTGDLGCLDKEGNLYIKGRIKDMIIVAGLNVYSPEVEHVIQEHPQVKEVAVVGVADKLRGEAVKAVVALKENKSITEQDIKAFCRERLTHFKIPHIVEFRESLPRTTSGKVQKELLK